MITERELTMAPCLADGPYSREARALIARADALGSERWSLILRAWCVPYLFHGMERIFRGEDEPRRAYRRLLADLTQDLDSLARSSFCDLIARAQHPEDGTVVSLDELEEITGRHYRTLFRATSPESYWRQPKELLCTRLERNGIDLGDLSDRRVLDQGCGGGRYTIAWRLLGAGEVIGLDSTEAGLEHARRQKEAAGIGGVTYVYGNVLDLPFENGSFDIVFSNGVLHHTRSWRAGLAEQLRVLRPGGLGFLYLIEKPGGVFWDNYEILRVILRDVDPALARRALKLLDLPGSRAFYMLDHVMVPINVRTTPGEIETELRRLGARGIRRFTRGTDWDRVEAIHRKEPYAVEKYGVGENRYVFSR